MTFKIVNNPTSESSIDIEKVFFTASLPKTQGGQSLIIPPLGMAGELRSAFQRSLYTQVELTPLQFNILNYLVQTPWQIKSYADVIKNSGLPEATTLKQLFDHLSKIQKQLAIVGVDRTALINVKGWGYFIQLGTRNEPSPDQALDIDGFAYLDLRNGQIVNSEAAVQLSRSQFNVVRVLLENSGEIISHQKIVALAELPEGTTEQQVRDYFKRLNPKLKQAGIASATIRNVRGLGYCALHPSETIPNSSQKLNFDYHAYLDLRTACIVNGDKSIQLSKSLFKIARALLISPWKKKTYKELIEVAELPKETSEQDFWNFLSDLKEKMTQIGLEKKIIISIPGGAYYIKTRRKAHAKPDERIRINGHAYLDARVGLLVNGSESKQLSLAYAEFLELLLTNKGEILSREELIDIFDLTDKTIEKSLPRKIEALKEFLAEVGIDQNTISTIGNFQYHSSKILLPVSEKEHEAYMCAYRKRVVYGENSEALTNREFTLLEILVKAPYQIFSREELMEALDIPEDTFDEVIGRTVNNVRKKLDILGIDHIRAVSGLGYYFHSNERPSAQTHERLHLNETTFLDLRCAQIVKGDLFWQLHKRDFSIIERLADNPEQLFPNDSFHYDEVNGAPISQQAYTSSIKRVRRILKEAETPPSVIKSVYGIGYYKINNVAPKLSI